MKCKRCGAEMPDAKRTCSECGAFLEGYTLNNVTGEYGYRGADGNFYKSEEDYHTKSSAAAQPAIAQAAKAPKYKKGAHVWAKRPKELAGRTGYVRAVDTYRMVYEVTFGTERWELLEDDLELVDPATEEARQTVFEREDDADQPLTEQAAYDEYQERSKVSGDRAEQLAWAMIVLLVGQLIGGSKYAEFYMLGGAALLYLLLSVMQSVWQSVTIWLVKFRIKRTGIVLSDYPDWVGFGAWVFYWLKMIIIAIATIYGASHLVSFAM